MCDHTGTHQVKHKEAPSLPEPEGDYCHTYYIHQEGPIYCQPNVRFQGHGSGTESKAFCGRDRLTLVHLPTSCAKFFNPQNIVGDLRTSFKKDMQRLIPPKPDPIPPYFKAKMRDICQHCGCKSDIVWRGFQKPEPHFDACFRYFDEKKKPNGRCFLKFHSLRLPFLSEHKLTLSVVQHIRAEGHQFIPANDGAGDNREHIFAFITGLTTVDLRDLLTDLFARWQDISHDHLRSSAGMTTRLFLAATLFQYGNIVKDSIIITYYSLAECDAQLRNAVVKLRQNDSEEIRDVTPEIDDVNERLVQMNLDLTGNRSTMHFLAENANLLVNRVSVFEDSVMRCLDDDSASRLKDELRKLDSYKESIRDKDKLEMVRKTMEQYKVDIEALQQHININVGMLRNVTAERDKTIQLGIMANTDRDGYKVKVISIMTIFLLPATFMAIFLTTPMFNWEADAESVTIKKPWRIYWETTIPITFSIIIGLTIVSNPAWLIKMVESWLPRRLRKWVEKTTGYKSITKRRKNIEDRQKAREKARHVSPVNTFDVTKSGGDGRTNQTVVGGLALDIPNGKRSPAASGLSSVNAKPEETQVEVSVV